MDSERFFSLLEKLGSESHTSRLRACQSLLSKVLAGIIDSDFIMEELVQRRLLTGISKLLSFQGAPASSELQEELRCALQMLELCVAKRRFQALAEPVHDLTRHLLRIKELGVSSPELHDGIVQSLDAFTRQVEVSEDSKDELRAAVLTDLAPPVNFHPQELECLQAPHGIQGAGAILYSRLSFVGRGLGSVILCESDDKFLFDLEVKLKLRHETCSKLLAEVVMDFPAAVLLDRSSIIYSLLDLIGTSSSRADTSSDERDVNAVCAIHALTVILRKAVQEASVILEGSLCGAMISHTEEEGQMDKLAQLLRSLRHPSRIMPYEIVLSAPGSIPRPSLSGLAFAAVAASLPLLRSKDLAILHSVHELTCVGFDLILEPISDSLGPTHAVNKQRCQHLVARFEQLLVTLSPCLSWKATTESVFDMGFWSIMVRFWLAVPVRLALGAGDHFVFPEKTWKALLHFLAADCALDGIAGQAAWPTLVSMVKLMDPDSMEEIEKSRQIARAASFFSTADDEHWPQLYGFDFVESLVATLENLVCVMADGSILLPIDPDDFVAAVIVVIEAATAANDHPILPKMARNLLSRSLSRGTPSLRIALFVSLHESLAGRRSEDRHFVTRLRERAFGEDCKRVNHGSLIAFLCTPSLVKLFIWVLLDWEHRQAEMCGEAQKRREDDETLCAMLQALNILSCHAATTLADDGFGNWLDVLQWLQLLLFSYGDCTDLAGVSDLVRGIEIQQHVAGSDATILSLATGLFHVIPSSRAHATLCLRKALGLASSLTQHSHQHVSQDAARIAQPLPGFEVVPFSKGPNHRWRSDPMVPTRPIGEDSLSPGSPSKGSALFTHAEARQVFQITFNSNLEMRIRLAAADQLLQMLSDQSLLKTSPSSFITQVLVLGGELCGEILMAYPLQLQQQQQQQQHIGGLPSSRSSSYSLLLSVIRLFQVVIKAFPSMCSCITFQPNKTASQCCLRAILLLLVGGIELAPDIDKDVRTQLWISSWHLLELLVLSNQRWSLQVSMEEGLELGTALLDAQSGLFIPRFLTMWCRTVAFPGATSPIGELLFPCLYSPDYGIILAAYEDLNLIRSGSMCAQVWKVLGERLRVASTTSDLREALDLCAVYSDFGHYDAQVQHVLELLCDSVGFEPRSKSERQLFRLQLRAANRVCSLTRRVGYAISKSGLEKLLLVLIAAQPFLASSPGSDAVQRDLCTETLQLLTTLQDMGHLPHDMLFPRSVGEMICANFLLDHVEPQLRAESVRWIENSVRTVEGLQYLQSCCDLVPTLARLAKVFLSPDSFRGNAVLVSALRSLSWIVRLAPADCDGDWNWLQRWLYDRRGEIKALALHLLEALAKSRGDALMIDAEESENLRRAMIHLCSDSYEAPGVRAQALGWLANAPASGSIAQWMEFAAELLSSSLPLSSGGAVRLVQGIMSWLRDSPDETSPLLVRLKILPRLLDLARPDYEQRHCEILRMLLLGSESQVSELRVQPKYVLEWMEESLRGLRTSAAAVDRMLLQLYYRSPSLFQEVFQRTQKRSHLLQSLAECCRLECCTANEARQELLHAAVRLDLLHVSASGMDSLQCEEIARALCCVLCCLKTFSASSALVPCVIQALCRFAAHNIHSFGDSAAETLCAQLVQYRLHLLKEMLAGVNCERLCVSVDTCIGICIQRLPHALPSLFDGELGGLLQFYVQTVIGCARCLPLGKGDAGAEVSAPSTGRELASKRREPPRATNPKGKKSTTPAPTAGSASWRDKTRSFAWQASASESSVSPDSLLAASASESNLEKALRRCHGALWVLQAWLPKLLEEKGREAVTESQLEAFFHALHHLQRVGSSWSLTSHLASSSTGDTGGAMDGQLAACVAACVSTLLGQCARARTEYLRTGPEDGARVLGSTGRGQSVHRLLTTACTPSQPPALRRLSLHCIAVLLPVVCPNSAGGMGSSSGLRSQVSLTLALRLQALLSNASAEQQVEAYFGWLPFVCALLQARAGPTCYEASTGLGAGAKGELMPFAELVCALAELPIVQPALFRGLCRLVWGPEDVQKLLGHHDVLRCLLSYGSESTPAGALAALCVKLMSRKSEKWKNGLTQLGAELGGGEGGSLSKLLPPGMT